MSSAEPRIVLSAAVEKWMSSPRARIDLQPTFPGVAARAQIIATLDRTEGRFSPLAKKLRAWLDDRERFTKKYDDETQVAAFNVLTRFNESPQFVNEWAQALGVEHAVRLAIHPRVVQVEGAFEKATLAPPATDPLGQAYTAQASLALVTPFVRDWSEEKLRAVRDALAEDIAPHADILKLRFATVLRDQDAIDAFVQRIAADQVFVTGFQGYATSPVLLIVDGARDVDAIEKIIRQNLGVWRYGAAPSLAKLLFKLPPARVKAVLIDVIPALEKIANGGDFKAHMQIAECVDDVDIALVVARHAHVKNLTPVAVSYFTRHPHRIDALEVVAKEKGKTGASASSLLDLIRRKAGDADVVDAPVANDADIPKFLLAPKWKSKKENASAREIPIPDLPATHLRPGEYANWIQSWHFPNGRDMAALRALVASKEPTAYEHFLEGLMSILGAESVPLVIELAARAPAHNIELLMHVVSPRAMLALATLLSKTKIAPRIRAWLVDHADVAAKGFVPAVTSTDAKLRAAAHAGIALLSANGKRDIVHAEAATLGIGPDALEIDDALPAPGKLPPFADASALPAPILAKTNTPLPRRAVENLLAILSVAPKDFTHPVVREIKDACTQASLDAFVWTLVSDYVLAGGNARFDWALFAAGHLGSDDIARKIDLTARKWVQKNVELMQKSLDVLALIGTDVALSFCYERGLAAKFEDTQLRARQILEEVAGRRGVTYEELEDNLVPELGLDAGPLVLDYGDRKFEVKLDERLAPFVVEDGQRKDKPPKATKRDDKDKVKIAIERFETFRDDLSHVARTQLLRLERAMREAREWEIDAWLREIVRHPLLRYVASRLVWRIDSGASMLVRVAEDGSLANDSDARVEPPKDARVRVAHRIDASPDAWSKMARVFADYSVLQPFEQLARETFEKPKDVKYTQIVGKKAAWNAVDDLLTGRGWLRTPPENGTVRVIEFPLDRFGASGGAVRLGIAPGLTIGRIKARPEQTLGELSIHQTTWGALDARIASELVRDATTLTR